MKSKNLVWRLYIGIIGTFLPMISCVGMSSLTAIKKSKRLQGMLTQTQSNQLTTEIDAVADQKSLSIESEPAKTESKIEQKKPLEETLQNNKQEQNENPLQKTAAKETYQEPKKIPASLLPQKPIEKAQPVLQQKKEAMLSSQDAPSVEFHFENTDLQNVVTQVSEIFDVTFITDDIVSPQPTGAKSLKGNKISFKTQRALSKKDAWDLFLSFLDLAGFAVVPQTNSKIYKIMPIDSANRSSLRSFIGIDPSMLPNNDETIRYVYFIENTSIDAIKGVIETLKSSAAPFQILQESKAFILTDKAYNIKSLMQIIKELDKVNLPQTLSVLKLRKADATQVKELYDTLSNNDDKNISARLFPARKQPTSLYFPENARIFAEPRTNTLILLGPQDAILKIEDFIIKYIDVDSDKPYSPLKVYTLKYADAESVAAIMNNVTQFGRNTEAGKSGGVRGEDKYLKSMSFTPEKSTNRIIIRGDYEDYLKAVEVIAKLDEPQAQVAIEILIVSLAVNDNKSLGTQLRSKIPATGVTNSPKFQTSGLFGQRIQENTNTSAPGVQRLLGNLLSLIGAASVGNTVVSLGTDAYGVWGVFAALESVANAQVVSNPFLTTTNKTPAKVQLGTTRRVTTANVIGGSTTSSSQDDLQAALTVNITPQINSDGMISLHLDIAYDDFVDATNPSSATMNKRKVVTDAIVADREVLAIGGLIQNTTNDTTTKVPILGDIPVLGWLFKNKTKSEQRNNILILVSTRILNPEKPDMSGPATQERINEYRNDIDAFQDPASRHDPVNKLFFTDDKKDPNAMMDEFLFKRKDQLVTEDSLSTKEMSRERRRKEARKRKKLAKQKQKEAEVLLNAGIEEAPKEIGI